MAHDYRLNPFTGSLDIVNITGEKHVIPMNSPYIVRLDEVPEKTSPSSISLEIDGTAAVEVASFPAAGEFWPDYSCDVEEDANWNTGALLFNAADAGKEITVSYKGTGTLVDVEKTRALHGIVMFEASGTWICPPGVTQIYLSMCGGGGGGGSATAQNENEGLACGGGGAQAYMKYAVTVSPHTEYAITVGAGGGAGADGTQSKFGTLLTAAGGKGGGASIPGAAGGAGGNAGGVYLGPGLSGGAGGGCLLGPGANSGDCTCYGGGGAGARSTIGTVAGGAGGPGVVIIEW